MIVPLRLCMCVIIHNNLHGNDVLFTVFVTSVNFFFFYNIGQLFQFHKNRSDFSVYSFGLRN